MTPTLVSVVVPACDEERWIEGCLESVAEQDHPTNAMEVIVVVDAASTDRTEELATRALACSAFARTEVLVAERPGTPANLNAGLAVARGDVVCRVDARSRVPRHYVRRCAEVLDERADVVVVGGSQSAIPPHRTAKGLGIARALNNRWAMGWSRYRRGAGSGPSDTVYLGAFRREELGAAGGWSIAMPTNQDFELNRRLGAQGVIWFDEDLVVDYVPRPGLRSLHRQYTRFGRWKVRYWRASGDVPQPRQIVMLAAPPSFAVAVAWALCRGTGAQRMLIGAGIAACALAVETAGSRRPAGGPSAHGWALAAIGACSSGWLSGIAREWIAGRPRG